MWYCKHYSTKHILSKVFFTLKCFLDQLWCIVLKAAFESEWSMISDRRNEVFPKLPALINARKLFSSGCQICVKNISIALNHAVDFGNWLWLYRILHLPPLGLPVKGPRPRASSMNYININKKSQKLSFTQPDHQFRIRSLFFRIRRLHTGVS